MSRVEKFWKNNKRGGASIPDSRVIFRFQINQSKEFPINSLISCCKFFYSVTLPEYLQILSLILNFYPLLTSPWRDVCFVQQFLHKISQGQSSVQFIYIISLKGHYNNRWDVLPNFKQYYIFPFAFFQSERFILWIEFCYPSLAHLDTTTSFLVFRAFISLYSFCHIKHCFFDFASVFLSFSNSTCIVDYCVLAQIQVTTSTYISWKMKRNCEALQNCKILLCE